MKLLSLLLSCVVLFLFPISVNSYSMNYCVVPQVTIEEPKPIEEKKELTYDIMSIDKGQLREVITEVLKYGEEITGYNTFYTEDAVELLMLTAAHESHLGTYLYQVGGGPAKGIFQMEPNTAQDILENYVRYKPELVTLIGHVCSFTVPFNTELKTNLALQIVMARIHYMRVREALPNKDKVRDMAKYWKKYYNTEAGAGDVSNATYDYNRLVKNV